MSTVSPFAFLAAYLPSSDCELFADETGEIIAYVPTRENWQAQLGLNVRSFVDAEVKAREMGLKPNWN